MESSESSFVQLLDRAPAVSSSDSVTVVGALARSPEQGKFVLATSDGQTHTLDIGAVRKHRVLAESVGQLLVELELDAKKVPAEVRSVLTLRTPTVAAADQQTFAEMATAAETTKEATTDYPVHTGWWDYGPGFGGGAGYGASPFIAATAHQAPVDRIYKVRYDPPNTGVWDTNTGVYDSAHTHLWGSDVIVPKPVPDDRIGL